MSARSGAPGAVLVGAGRMARTHARVLARSGALDVRWVVDPDPASAAELAAALGARADRSLDGPLADPGVDAAIVVTPTDTHAQVVQRVAAAGRHAFVEKPVAADLGGAVRTAEAVERAGTVCQVGFQRRYDPAYAAAKRRIDAGDVGTPEMVRLVSRDPAPPPKRFLRRSGGLMVDFAIHDLDLALHLLGPVSEVRAVGAALIDPSLAEEGLFDTAVATLRFESGALGWLEAGLRTGYGYEIRTEVVGSLGRLQVDQERAHGLTLADGNGVRHHPPADFEARFEQAYELELRAFARAVRGERPAWPDAREGCRTLALALAAQHALVTGEPVDVRRFTEDQA